MTSGYRFFRRCWPLVKGIHQLVVPTKGQWRGVFIYEFILIFRWILFLGVDLTIYYSSGSDNGLAPIRQQAIIWNKDGKFTDAYIHHSDSKSYTYKHIKRCMMVLWHGITLRIIDPLCGEPPVMYSFDVSLLSTQTQCWTNARVANDLRHHDAHVTSLQWVFGRQPRLCMLRIWASAWRYLLHKIHDSIIKWKHFLRY